MSLERRIAALSLVSLVACAPATRPPSDEAAVTLPAPPPSASGAHSASPPMTAAAPTSSVEVVTGIPACDAYLAAYAACRDRLRPIEMAGELPVFESARARLKMEAGTPEGKAQLPDACSAMHDAIRPKCR